MIYTNIPKKLFCSFNNFEFLYGLNTVQIALIKRRRIFDTLFVSDSSTLNIGPKLKKIMFTAQQLNIPVKFQHKDKLSRLVSKQPHQNIVLKCSQLKPNIEKQPHQYPPGLYVYCDKITDPQNFGSIVRSCVFFGIKSVFVPHKNSCPLNSTVSKTSAGALELIDIDAIKKEELFLEKWREDAGIIISTEVSQGVFLDVKNLHKEVNLHERKVILIMGSEGAGVSPHLYRHSDFSVTIPRSQNSSDEALLVDSLNVSSALTCILYEMSKLK